jgi:hypothetical protein
MIDEFTLNAYARDALGPAEHERVVAELCASPELRARLAAIRRNQYRAGVEQGDPLWTTWEQIERRMRERPPSVPPRRTPTPTPRTPPRVPWGATLGQSLTMGMPLIPHTRMLMVALALFCLSITLLTTRVDFSNVGAAAIAAPRCLIFGQCTHQVDKFVLVVETGQGPNNQGVTPGQVQVRVPINQSGTPGQVVHINDTCSAVIVAMEISVTTDKISCSFEIITTSGQVIAYGDLNGRDGRDGRDGRAGSAGVPGPPGDPGPPGSPRGVLTPSPSEAAGGVGEPGLSPTPAVSPSSTPVASNSATTTPSATPTIVPSQTPSATPAPSTTTPSATPTLVPSQTPSAMPTPSATATLVPSSTPSTTLTPSATATPRSPRPVPDLIGHLGETIMVRGDGPPGMAVLLWFDGRVVGGGSVKADGRFAIPLPLKDEAPGRHQVVVRERDGTMVLLEQTCVIVDDSGETTAT